MTQKERNNNLEELCSVHVLWLLISFLGVRSKRNISVTTGREFIHWSRSSVRTSKRTPHFTITKINWL